MIHPEVDIERWISMFPFAEVRDNWRRAYPDGYYSPPRDIFSPQDLAITQQLRDELGGPPAMGPSKPLDLLLPASGEPPRRCISKIGGVPYRPKGVWPKGTDGKPLSFIAQLCLADSPDILPMSRSELPGDVLLIFQEGTEAPWGEATDFGSTLKFEWQPIGIPESDLVQPSEAPLQPVNWKPTYFERFRTTDHPNFPPPIEAKADQMEISCCYRASKFGGVPIFQQSEGEADGLGNYFACLHSINPTVEEYPFPNTPVSPWGDWPHDEGFFMLGDVGTLYLFAAGNGRVGWLVQCG
jgi:hypothetical protein